MTKIIELSGIVGYDITAKNLKNRLPKDGEKAVLKIDSVGGSVFEGNRLYNTINDHLNRFPGSLTGELGAIAASAASYFPLALGVENINVRNNTTFMGHKAWTFAIGNADDMKAEAEILDGFDNIIAKVYSKVTGKPVEESLEDMKNEFWLIGGQSVVDAGFASGIIDDDESTESEEPENVVEKNEILALMKEAKNKIREVENSEDLNKWAARIHDTLNSTDIEDDGQKLLFSKSAPQGAENKQRGDKMNLTDLLKANPEAKAEHDNLIAAANTERVENAVTEERTRIDELLNLAGGKVTTEIVAAIKNGDSIGDFAVNEIKNRNKEIEEKNTADSNLGDLDAGNQTPIEPKNEDDDKSVKTMDAAIDALLGKKGDK